MLINRLMSFCRRMELLPADVHRIVALVEIPSTSSRFFSRASLRLAWTQKIPYAIPIFFPRSQSFL